MMQKSTIAPGARGSRCSGTVTCLEKVKRPIHANMERLIRPSGWIQQHGNPVFTSVVYSLSVVGKIACRTNCGVQPDIAFPLLRLCMEFAHNTGYSHKKNKCQLLIANTANRFFLNF